MLSDTKTCEVLKKDPTPTYMRKLVSILSRLKQEETSSAVAEMGACGHNRHGPKRGGWCCAPFAMWPAPMSTSVPSGIFIHPAICPQYWTMHSPHRNISTNYYLVV